MVQFDDQFCWHDLDGWMANSSCGCIRRLLIELVYLLCKHPNNVNHVYSPLATRKLAISLLQKIAHLRALTRKRSCLVDAFCHIQSNLSARFNNSKFCPRCSSSLPTAADFLHYLCPQNNNNNNANRFRVNARIDFSSSHKTDQLWSDHHHLCIIVIL